MTNKTKIIMLIIISSILTIMVKVLGHDDIPLQLSDSHIAQPSPSYVFVNQWGSNGSEDGQFNKTRYIALDKSDNIYTSDAGDGRIQKFDSEGNFILKKSIGVSLNGITVDGKGYIYVVDCSKHQIQKFDSQGNFILKWGSEGLGDGQLNQPTCIASDPEGYIHIIDSHSTYSDYMPVRLTSRIEKFDSNGNFITQFEFSDAVTSIAINSMGYIFVALRGFWGQSLDIIAYNSLKGEYPGKGTWTLPKKGEAFKDMLSLAADTEGNLFALDISGCVYKIDSTGKILTKWGSSGSGDGEFNQPKAIAVDSKGNVYVLDTGNYRIQKFSPNP
jgi:DNA-binding beta-propeller fold protein YncE